MLLLQHCPVIVADHKQEGVYTELAEMIDQLAVMNIRNIWSVSSLLFSE
jgi:hypothetical protein